MTFPRDSLLLVDFTATIKGSDVIVDSTNRNRTGEDAPDDSEPSGSRLVSISSVAFAVTEGFNEALAESEVGATLRVEVPPEKGYGKRDPGKVRMVPHRKFGDDAEKISVGDSIVLDNKPATIRHIGSGRVQLDYNHKYAGKTIVYDATVLKFLQSDDEIVERIIAERFPHKNLPTFTICDGEVTIDIPQELFRLEALVSIKYLTQLDIFGFTSGLTKLSFIESFANKKAQSAPPPGDEAVPAQAPQSAPPPGDEAVPAQAPQSASA